MSTSQKSKDYELSLAAIPLHRSLDIHVLCDSGGVSIFGLGPLRGYTSSGTKYEQALSIFIDSLITDYYHFVIHPSGYENGEDLKRGDFIRSLFWKKHTKDEETSL